MRALIEYLDCFGMVLHGEGQILAVLGTGLDGTSAATICPDWVSTLEQLRQNRSTTYLQEKSMMSINYVEQDLRKYAGSVLVPCVES